MQICARLRLALDDAGLRQKDVAEKLAVKPAVVSRWLSGKSNIGVRTLSDLAWAIGCELDVDFIDRASGKRTGELRYPV